jgi:3-oxoacyl-[acyl-carrier protein] reductase
MNRLAQPNEIGEVIAFLASERASYVNGQCILVNGGK